MKAKEGQSTGAEGEDLVARWLTERGWEVLERNFVCNLGEIDVIACRYNDEPTGPRAVILFGEVKTRARSYGPRPEVRVRHGKRRKVVRLAQLYLARQGLKGVVARFDVFGVDLDTGEVRHYPAAFDDSGALR